MSIDLSSSDLISDRSMSFSKVNSGLRLIFSFLFPSSSERDSSFTLESTSLSSESVSCLFIRFGCGLLALGGLCFFALMGVDAFVSFLHSSLKNGLIVVFGNSAVSFEPFLLLFFFWVSFCLVILYFCGIFVLLPSMFIIDV